MVCHSYHTLVTTLVTHCLSKCLSTSWCFCQDQQKMVEKANADLIKNIQKNLMVMERDQLAPLGQQVPQHHTSQITTLIITLHEIKPLDLSHADTDKYWKLVDNILKVRDEYMECMKIGEALLEMA